MIRLALLLSLLTAAPAQAADMAFYLKNHTTAGVQVELSSRDRDKVWPGDGKVYLLDPAEKQFVQVECKTGENICYGAWVNGAAGTFWGVGPDRGQQCADCCVTCVAKTTTTIDIGP